MTNPRTILALLTLGGGLTLWSCVEISPSFQECVDACSLASRCGLLPSALGGNLGLSTEANERDCVARCEASDRTTPQVDALLKLFEDTEHDDITSLCRPSGLRECEEFIEEISATPYASELNASTRLTVFMNSAVSHASNFSLESWCCFDYTFDIYESPDDYLGDGVEEIQKVYDMFEPTYRCLLESIAYTEAAGEALMPEGTEPGADPLPPDEEAAELACQTLHEMWRPVQEPADPAESPCLYAQDSTRVKSLEIDALVQQCIAKEATAQEMFDLKANLERVVNDWKFASGGLLVDGSGTLRSVEEVETLIEAEIRDELARPMGFLEDACDEYFEERYEDLIDEGLTDAEITDELLCDPARRGQQLDVDDCSGGPPCSRADCLADSPTCNPALCDAEISSPNSTCSFFGVTELRLGYRTKDGTENYGPPITDCADQGEIVSVFPNVRVGVVTPLATITGIVGNALDPEGEPNGNTYTWSIEGESRWVSAGAAELELASPELEVLVNTYSNPMEFLEWVVPRLPVGLACDNRSDLCEGFFNDNCDDGVDNDGDGLVDLEAAWCDELFKELVSRCVVDEPGRQPAQGCEFDPPDPFGDPEDDGPPEPGEDEGEPPDSGDPPGSDGPPGTEGPPDTGESMGTGGTMGPPMGTGGTGGPPTGTGGSGMGSGGSTG